MDIEMFRYSSTLTVNIRSTYPSREAYILPSIPHVSHSVGVGTSGPLTQLW